MSIEIKFFSCKKCSKFLYAIDEEIFDEVYKDQFLCVTCRSEQEGIKLTKPEEIGLLFEKSKATNLI